MRNPIGMLLARCSLVLTNAASKLQTLQVRLLAGEVKSSVEHLEPYGFTSHAQPGAEGLAVFLNGDRSHGVVICIADRRFRLTALKPGEVALYTDEGDHLHFQRDRIVELSTATFRVKASTAVEFETPLISTTGKVVSDGDQIAGGISQIEHVHQGDSGGLTGAPIGG